MTLHALTLVLSDPSQNSGPLKCFIFTAEFKDKILYVKNLTIHL
jgi:hypothetical protein